MESRMREIRTYGLTRGKSHRQQSRGVDVPDFTRGGWKDAKPLGIVDVDLDKMGFDAGEIKRDESALSV